METLVKVIGPAPSELGDEEWTAKLEGERRRILNEINNFKLGLIKQKGCKKTASPKSRAKKTKKTTRDAAKVLGLTKEKMQEIIEKARAKEKEDSK